MSIIDVVVGAAFGSEGKGHVTAQVVKKHHAANLHVLNIRVAGPNAGHTVIDAKGQSFALRAVPVGAAIHDDVSLYIAPGSEVDLPVLVAEIEDLRSKGHRVKNLWVSGEATLLEDHHKVQEVNRGLSERIGSTAKGIGAARADRIWREASRIKDHPATVQTLRDLDVRVTMDDADLELVDTWLKHPAGAIVIEGTQGYGLGLHAGLYPTVTSSDCRAIDFLAMAGISPWHSSVRHISVWLVARVHPIRVAGNSGPLLGETSWDKLELPEEHTTVTKKVRRVGAWDSDLVRHAVIANGGGQRSGRTDVVIALTMVDQMFPSIAAVSNPAPWTRDAPEEEVAGLRDFMNMVETETGAAIGLLSTSDRDVIWRL